MLMAQPQAFTQPLAHLEFIDLLIKKGLEELERGVLLHPAERTAVFFTGFNNGKVSGGFCHGFSNKLILSL